MSVGGKDVGDGGMSEEIKEGKAIDNLLCPKCTDCHPYNRGTTGYRQKFHCDIMGIRDFHYTEPCTLRNWRECGYHIPLHPITQS